MLSKVSQRTIRDLYSTREALNEGEYFYVRYRIVPPKGMTLEESAARVLLVTSLRTMAAVAHENVSRSAPQAGAIISAEDTGQIDIAYPMHLCSETEGLPQLLQLITSAAEYAYTEDIWIESIDLPKAFIGRFKGPRFGVPGIRKMFDNSTTPILGVVIKPRFGSGLDDVIRASADALIGGADFLVDDLLMVDPDGDLSFKMRVPRIAERVNNISQTLGKPKHYFVNCTATPRRMLENAVWAQSVGASGIVVNGFAIGFGTLQELIQDLDGLLPVISSNMGSGIVSRGTAMAPVGKKPTGMSEAVISKISRLAGADAVHAGTSASECYGEEAWGPAVQALNVPTGMLPCFAVAEGDLTVANLWENIQSLSLDVLIEPTVGIYNYPGGPGKGAESFRKLLNMLKPNMSAEEAREVISRLSTRDKSLAAGLRYFGWSPKAN